MSSITDVTSSASLAGNELTHSVESPKDTSTGLPSTLHITTPGQTLTHTSPSHSHLTVSQVAGKETDMEDTDEESMPVTPEPGNAAGTLYVPTRSTSPRPGAGGESAEETSSNQGAPTRRRRANNDPPPRPSPKLSAPPSPVLNVTPSAGQRSPSPSIGNPQRRLAPQLSQPQLRQQAQLLSPNLRGAQLGGRNTGTRRSLLDLPQQPAALRSSISARPGIVRTTSENGTVYRLRNARSHSDLYSASRRSPTGRAPIRVPSEAPARPNRPVTPRKKQSNAGQEQKNNNSDEANSAQVERDSYGFRKGNQYLSLEEIHKFEAEYAPILQRRREKWEAMLRDYEVGQLPPVSAKVKRFIRKGIPAHLRGLCWLRYSGAMDIMKQNRGRYQQLVALSADRKYREYRDLIERDLHRTFPENILFTAAAPPKLVRVGTSNNSLSPGAERKERRASPVTSRFRQQPTSSTVPILQQLRRVLMAFAVRCPSVGYCQSLNYVAGLLLLFMSEEEAFWMLCTIVERIMPEGMYGVKMEGVTVDQEVLMRLIEERMPAIGQRLKRDSEEAGAPPITFVTSHWFLTLYVDVLPIESNLRVWDCLFLEGSEVLFRVALTLFKLHEQQICSIEDPLELFQYLQNMPKRVVNCHWLMENCYRKLTSLTHISAKELERRRKQARDVTLRRLGASSSTAAESTDASSRR